MTQYQIKSIYMLFIFTILFHNDTSCNFPKKMIINTIITDLREQPKQAAPDITLPASPETNPLQTSQLLLGEYIIAHEEIINEQSEHWLKVSALQQKIYYEEHGWQGYPGWIQADHAIEVQSFPRYNLVVQNLLVPVIDEMGNELYKISIGTRLNGIKNLYSDYWHVTLPNNKQALIHDDHVYELYKNWNLDEMDLRNAIVQRAKQFLGSDYSWGGRSAQNNQVHISSVDCSATVHLSYLTQGLQIPRMSHEQFLGGCEIEYGKDIKTADLIMFSSLPNLRRIDLPHIDHVMLYIGDDMILESTMAGDKKVRIIPCQQRLGKSIHEIVSGDLCQVDDYKFYVYFASYLHSSELIMQLRENAVRYHAKFNA